MRARMHILECNDKINYSHCIFDVEITLSHVTKYTGVTHGTMGNYFVEIKMPSDSWII